MMKKLFILLLLLFISFTSYSQRPAKFKDGIELKPINAPSTPNKGTIYFDLAQDIYFGWNGTKWLNLSSEHEVLIDGYWVDKKANTDESNIEVGDQIRGNFATNNYIIANVTNLPHTFKPNLALYLDNYLDDFIVSSFFTLSSTSTLVSWSPDNITNPGPTLDWTVSGGVTIAKTTINDPTFDFNTNTGIADILVENTEGLTHINIDNLDIVTFNLLPVSSLLSIRCTDNSISILEPKNNVLLQEIFFDDNLLTTIDIDLNVDLIILDGVDNNLSTLGISNNIVLRFLRINGNNFSSTELDQKYIDLDNNGVINGILDIDLGRTAASDAARANLITDGWAITEF